MGFGFCIENRKDFSEILSIGSWGLFQKEKGRQVFEFGL